MIIITDEILLNVFGKERVPFCRDLLMYSLKALIEKEAYGKDITDITQYDPQRDAQEYVDNWMNSTIAKKEAEEYFKKLSFKGEDDMNKYETLLKKYQALYKDYEAYRETTIGIADKGTYVTNEALAELLECKKKYDELKEERDILIKEGCQLHEEIKNVQEKCKHLMRERDGFEKENKALYKEFKDYRDFATKKYDELTKERDSLVQEVYHLHDVIRTRQEQVKEKMEKLKQQDKKITDLETIGLSLAKERDEFKQRLEHINAMSNLEWEFEVVEETETTRTPYDELVDFCESRRDSCVGCPRNIACDGINHGLRPNRWNEDEIAEYNELMNMKEDK